MIRYAEGNLLEADVEAVVNTVNTVGVMGKGIALMFKEAFPANFEAYARACEAGEIRTGGMFVTERKELFGPRWIINFPTKTHWRVRSRMEWIDEGLKDLVRVIREKRITSIAVPPLGCGNGGLNWNEVRPKIAAALGAVEGLRAVIYEPTSRYQNVAKRSGVEALTPARALIAEIVRRYLLPGIDCSLLEVQKLGWFIERGVRRAGINHSLEFKYAANRYGPYSDRLRHMLSDLDGSYLRSDRRLADARPQDLIRFNDDKADFVAAYLGAGEGKPYAKALAWATEVIDGFESPLGMELLATVDWLIEEEQAVRTIEGVKSGLRSWPAGPDASERKLRIFDDRLIGLALDRLDHANRIAV